jgi:hypothetical protein
MIRCVTQVAVDAAKRMPVLPTTLRNKFNRHSPTAATQPRATTSSKTIVKSLSLSLIELLFELDYRLSALEPDPLSTLHRTKRDDKSDWRQTRKIVTAIYLTDNPWYNQ